MHRLVLLSAVLALGSAIFCPTGYTNYNDICYKLYNTRLTRYNAAMQCQNDGGFLPTIIDKTHDAYIYNLAKQVGSVFLGAVCTKNLVSSCRFDDSTPMVAGGYQNFYGDAPFLKYGNCVWMAEGPLYSGEWASIDCFNQTSPFVCQWGANPYCPPADITATEAQPSEGPLDGYCNSGAVLMTPVTIYTPNWPGQYIPNYACMWHIHSTTSTANIVFTDINLGDGKIEIYYDNTLTTLMETIRGNNVTTPYTLHDIDYNPSIVFTAADGAPGYGFRAEIRASENSVPKLVEDKRAPTRIVAKN